MTQLHYGTKAILATAMTRQAYNDYRGWTLPEDENGDDAGYLVEYVDGGASNHPDHAGYISWSPADVFDRAYQPANAMSFGHAIAAMKEGQKVARAGWNGKGMWVALVGWHSLPRVIHGHDEVGPYFAIRPDTAHGMLRPWSPSQTDMLADEWQIVA